MKKIIGTMRNNRLVDLFIVAGALLIAFPEHFTGVAPHLLGVALMVYSVISFVVVRAVPKLGRALNIHEINPGRSFVLFVLGGAILAQPGNAIGPIGSIWAMLSMYEVMHEINEMAEGKHLSLPRTLIALISTALAMLLLFDPEEHFAFHVRVLGLEMIFTVIQRKIASRVPVSSDAPDDSSAPV